MLLAGDISLGGEYKTRSGSVSGKWTAPFLEIKPVFSGCDIRVGNLESPLFSGQAPKRKRNSLRAQPDAVEALSFLGFSALSLANNHFTDQGPEGLVKTRDILTSCNISHFGAGVDLASARDAAVIQSKDLTFAFLGYAAGHQEVGAQPATESHWGCAPLSLELIEKDIAAVRGKVSHIVVSLHWGYQFDHYPEPEQIRMAHKIIDLGALIVHGHHPHVVQGMERYRNGLILYSLGNFFFPNFKRTDGCWFSFPKESRRTVIAICDVDVDGVQSVSLIPLRVGSDNKIHMLHGSAAKKAVTEYARRSSALQGTDYVERWSARHRKTAAWRMRLEFKLRLCGEMRALYSRVRERGALASIARLRGRHLIALFYKIRHAWRRDH